MADKLIDGMYQKDPNVGYGIGGINGMHHDVLGWDNTTVGMASSIFDNLLTQFGVRSHDPNHNGALEPLRTGKFIVKWLKVPPFFNPTVISYLKFFLEQNVRQVEGVPDNSISPISATPFGATSQESDYPGGYKQNGKEVTLTTFTCTGDGFGKLMRYWKYGITDPVTGVHHMYGQNLRFIRPNYSGTFIYILLGPTARPGDIEYACIWNEVWPTSPDGSSKFNSGTLGEENAISDQTETFTAQSFIEGPEVNILAKYIVAGTGLAGQSYFDQVLPAYMYEQYLDKLSKADSETIKSISIAQSDKLAAAKDVYTESILTIRKDNRDRYGLNSESIPSTNYKAEESIKELNSYNKEQFKDKIENSTT